MVGTTSYVLAALAAGGVIGLSDQYLALSLFGIAVYLGWIQTVGTASFIGEPWFIGVAILAYLLTNLPLHEQRD